MSFATEPFRAWYRRDVGTDHSSNAYVSYLNKVDALVGGLDEKLRRLGITWVDDVLLAQPSEAFGREQLRGHCRSAARAYARFLETGDHPIADLDLEDSAMPQPVTEQDDLRDLLRAAQELGGRYYRLTGKPLGVTGEVAELEAAEKLGLTLMMARTPGHDAVRSDGWRVQIKGRAVRRDDRYRGRCPSIKGCDFDSVALVLLDRLTLQPIEIWEAPTDAVLARIEAPGGRARTERRSLAITQFKSIAIRVWQDAA